MTIRGFSLALVFSVAGLGCGASLAAVIPAVSVTGHHQGDSAPPGDGSVSTAVNLAGISAGDVSDPTTWTHSNAWQHDWQGRDIHTLTSNVGWWPTWGCP